MAASRNEGSLVLPTEGFRLPGNPIAVTQDWRVEGARAASAGPGVLDHPGGLSAGSGASGVSGGRGPAVRARRARDRLHARSTQPPPGGLREMVRTTEYDGRLIFRPAGKWHIPLSC